MRKIALVLVLLAPLMAKDAKFRLPAPNPAGNTPNAPKVVPQPAGKQLQVPAGFQVEEYAGGFKKPRYMVQLPNGAVLITETVPSGGVYIVTKGGAPKPLITGLDRPFGMALWKEWLYVTEVEAVKRYKLDTATMTAGKGEEVVSLKGYTKGHTTRSIAFDEKTGKMYVAVGSGSNVDLGDPEDRNAINVYNPDGTGHTVFATGLRNPVSIRWNPTSHKLWTTVQERDGLGDDLAPDFFTSLKQGGFYGWPYSYIGKNEDPRHKGVKPELVKKALEPDMILAPHASAMDFVFYTGKQFPAKYRNGAFIASRGSSGRTKRLGYELLFVPFKGGKPSGPPEKFLTGFMLGEDVKEVWGRPVGVLQMADGSLLLSEDGNNKVFRISYGK